MFKTGCTLQSLVFITLSFLDLPIVLGSPTGTNRLRNRAFVSRDNNNGSNRITPQIWIPILVIALVLSGFAILAWSKRTLSRGLASLTGGAVAGGAAVQTPTAREVTAEQLAGGRNGSRNEGTGTTGRPRRTRRPRRTPSQVSTTSLPAYMKEPGDEELVIYRGPEDMEDAPMPPIVMPALDEDPETSMHSRGDSQMSDYATEPMSPPDTPLLVDDDDDDAANSPSQPRAPPGEGMPGRRRSTESTSTSEGASSLMRSMSRISTRPDPRGEAPPYFEVVDLNDSRSNLQTPDSGATPSIIASSAPTTSDGSTTRRSAFFSLWQRTTQGARTGSSSSAPVVPSHSRGDSLSVPSPQGSPVPDREGSRSRISHRATPSGSSSILSHPFRTMSRQKSLRSMHSTNNLTSPSMISLNSISSPLSHTLVRTEFTYPKAGPTPQQVKLISSRESFARFGKPYGADAIAFAASASQFNLEPPPPEFDAVQSDSQLPRSGETSGPSTSGSGSGSSSSPSRARSDSTPNQADSPEERRASQPEAVTQSPPQAVESQPEAARQVASAEPTPIASSAPHDHLQPPTPLSANGAPSSFRMPSGVSRSESRASSVQTFATAVESLPPSPGPAMDSDSDDESAPPTPRMQPARHVLEPTDATITQSNTGVAM
ncbi:hypothetical protein HGRIS_012391 [Hohenbuehelia grisea]|uniref:Uncharacterized protein n=1 Tax=Hohenbuehelia grisea TaxID=104357 RepID=A0ABR3IS46_9AGAR